MFPRTRCNAIPFLPSVLLVRECEQVVDIQHIYYLRLVSSLPIRKNIEVSCIYFYDLVGSKLNLDPWTQMHSIVRRILFSIQKIRFKRIFYLKILRLCSCFIFCRKLLNKVSPLCSNEKSLLTI